MDFFRQQECRNTCESIAGRGKIQYSPKSSVPDHLVSRLTEKGKFSMSNADHHPSGFRSTKAAHSQSLLSIRGETAMQSQIRLVILVTFSMLLCELFVMFILYLINPLPIWVNASLDAVLLVTLMSPILYFGLFRTLVRHIEECRQVEKELRERMLAEKKLQQIKSNLQAVFDSIADPLVLMEKDMTVKMINSSAARYYGLSDYQDIIGTRCHELLMGSAAPCDGCKVPDGIASGKAVMFERKGFMEKDRLEQVFLYPVARKESRDGDILLRISDITEQRMMERQLIHNEKMTSLGIQQLYRFQHPDPERLHR
jgi:PAS domain-containing protein